MKVHKLQQELQQELQVSVACVKRSEVRRVFTCYSKEYRVSGLAGVLPRHISIARVLHAPLGFGAVAPLPARMHWSTGNIQEISTSQGDR